MFTYRAIFSYLQTTLIETSCAYLDFKLDSSKTGFTEGEIKQEVNWVVSSKQVKIGSISVFDVGTNFLELSEDLCEEAGLSVNPEHGLAQFVDDGNTSVPEFLLI